MRGNILNTIKATGRTIPELTIQIEVINDTNEPIKIVGYSMKIYCSNLLIGNIFNFENIYLDSKGHHYFNEDFIITPYLFNSIEKVRNFGDLPIYARVNCLNVKQLQEINKYDFDSLDVENVNISEIKLSQSEWAKIVSDMGYKNNQIFEISYSKVPEISDFEMIIKRLDEAQEHFNQGRNEEVVTSCRKAFESLKPLVAIKKLNKLEMIPALSGKIDSVYAENNHTKKSELIENLRQKIWPILHMGPHEGYNVTRDDAEYILTLSLSTIRYYGVQLSKLSEI